MRESEPSTARFNEGAVHFSVSCTGFSCGVMPKGSLWHITPGDAANAWNTRASGWISVDERLPEIDGGRFLVKVQKTAFNSSGVEISTFSRVISPAWEIERIRSSIVTDWMPLP